MSVQTSYLPPEKSGGVATVRPLPAGNPGIHLSVVSGEGIGEVDATVFPGSGEDVRGIIGRLGLALEEQDAVAAQILAFGDVSAYPSALEAMGGLKALKDCPITWVGGTGADGRAIAGIQAIAFQGVDVETLRCGDEIVGRLVCGGQARRCYLGGIGPSDVSASPAEQSRQTFAAIERGLSSAGMNAHDIARTWFYLDDILAWYDPFNRARREWFAAAKLNPAALPASTGIGAPNPRGGALVAAAVAMRASGEGAMIDQVPSPKQGPAPVYGSAFSRAVQLSVSGVRRLFVSGTASIGPDGLTYHIGDLSAQIGLTMDVVEAILASRGYGRLSVARAVVYVREQNDIPAFYDWLGQSDWGPSHAVVLQSTVCRDDLLFEIELDAVEQDHA